MTLFIYHPGNISTIYSINITSGNCIYYNQSDSFIQKFGWPNDEIWYNGQKVVDGVTCDQWEYYGNVIVGPWYYYSNTPDNPPIPVQSLVTSFEDTTQCDYSQFTYGVDPNVFEIPKQCKYAPELDTLA